MPNPVVVVLLVVVQPDLGQPDGVPSQDVDARPPLVGRSLPEDVAHVGAGNDLKGPAAHPSLKRSLFYSITVSVMITACEHLPRFV